MLKNNWQGNCWNWDSFLQLIIESAYWTGDVNTPEAHKRLKCVTRVQCSWIFVCKPYLETLAAACKSRFSSNFACVSHFFVHFFAVTTRLQCETTLFHVLWKVKTQDNNFLFLFFKFANIWQTERDIWNKCVKFEVLSVIQFLSYAFAAVKLDWSGQSFILVPNMVLSKVNIYEHRTKQTYESDTFQPLTSFWYYEIKQELNSFQSQCVCFWHIFFSSGYSACELWPSHQRWWTSYKSQWSATKEKVRV